MRRDVKRYEKAIRDAYIELCAKKGHDHVKVSDIIKEADISRSTFYAHYEDIRQLEKEMAETFVKRAMDRKRQIGNGFILCCLRRYTALQGGADDETEHIRTLENNYR